MAVKSQGTTFSAGGTVLGQVRSIKPPQRKSDPIETTTLDSTEEQRIPGLPDRDTCTVTLLYSSALAMSVAALFNVPNDFVITFPNSGGTISWHGFVSGEGVSELKKNGIVEQELTITATGSTEDEDA